VRAQRTGLTDAPAAGRSAHHGVALAADASITADDLTGSPAWLPLEAVGEELRVVRLDEAAYRRESFLDQRLLTLNYEQKACPLTIVRAAAARLAPPSCYIFHTGHVGSTLISRLLGSHEQFFAVREPALLRAIAAPAVAAAASSAAAACAQRAIASGPSADGTTSGAPGPETALPLLGRTWRANQRAVVKATSFVSELAAALLAAAERPAAILMYTQPLQYLRGILAGANSRAETRQLAPARLERLRGRLGEGEWRAALRSEGEYIAMSWLCEMTALGRAAARFEREVLWVDFDAFLGEPHARLDGIFRALGARLAAGEIAALIEGPLMRQYSKAPEHAYDARLRREVLQCADREHGHEIRRGMQWLERVAARHPQIAPLLA